MDYERLISEMTVEEKAALVSGTDYMYTNPIPRLGIPSLRMSDGPHGLRVVNKEDDYISNTTKISTAFPTAATTACSWNPDVTRKMGEAMAEEARYYGIHTILGPGVNIKRNPLCGRNFEYFSEDPYLAGVMGASQIEGIQSKGVGVSLKHFALNNSEDFRLVGNSVASENTIRRLYLRQFEYIVKKAKPCTVMCAYNRLNGVYCSENKWLLTDILRNEWGFDGVVMSDWGAVNNRVDGIKAGLDLEMPGDTTISRRRILDAVSDGSLSLKDLDKACLNILKWVDRYVLPQDTSPVDWKAHHDLTAELAADSAVLMKNNGVLPLDKSVKLHIEGKMYDQMRYQGAGSSLIHPSELTTPKDAFEKRGIKNYPLDECDIVLVFIGLTDYEESEGCDRDNMNLADYQLKLIDDLCESGKKVVVVLFGGSPVEMPFFDKVDAVLNMYLPGQNGGTAVYKLLFGEINPSGKLAESWPLRYEDVPSAATYSQSLTEVYSEGCEVGYRYYNSHDIPVRCSFGFGLSYTSFDHSDWIKEGDEYVQTVTNTGDRYGGEVAQLYIDGELRGFEKVYLKPGESRTVRITPQPVDTKNYSDVLPPYEEPDKLPITIESRVGDLNLTFFGRIMYKMVMFYIDSEKRQIKKMPDGAEKDNKLKDYHFLHKVIEANSIRSMSMSSKNDLPYNYAQGVVNLANGHIIKGIKCFFKKIKVPKLPKEQQTD